MDSQDDQRRGPLTGLKVVEFAQLIAAPICGSLLADLGADVVHVEMPGVGDPQRVVGISKNDTSLWWKVSGRNKRSLTIDLRTPRGQDIAKCLVKWADVVITNFRPAALEAWGLAWDQAHELNPKLVMLHITGFGLGTSWSDRPGFGKVGEAMSGVVYVTGFPDGPPVHTGFSHGDSVAGLFGAFGVMAALYRQATDPDFDGELVDIALFEALFRLVEWQIVMCDQLGEPPQRAGNRPANVPAAVVNTYKSADGEWLTITSGTPRSVQKVAAMLGEPAEDYDTPSQQWEKQAHLDALLSAYIASVSADDALAEMAKAEVVASRIYSAQDILDDPIYAERGDIITVDDADLGPIRMQAALPKLHSHPGHVWRAGPTLGEDNDLVLRDYLGLTEDEVRELET